MVDIEHERNIVKEAENVTAGINASITKLQQLSGQINSVTCEGVGIENYLTCIDRCISYLDNIKAKLEKHKNTSQNKINKEE